MTKRRQNILNILAMVQNHPANVNQDIMTITGFMGDDEEVVRHAMRYAANMDAASLANIVSRARALNAEASR